jgi:cyclophilin family peptidyl-prolyl cis-trans isomerase
VGLALVLMLGVAAATAVVADARGMDAGAATANIPETCPMVPASRPRVEHLKAPRLTVTRADRLEALITTNCGRFAIELDARRFPVAVNSFVYLARSGFYDGLRFNRVVPDFVIEGGDPRGNGTSGPGYHVIDPPPRNFHYRLGTVAMGKTSAEPRGQAGSDFFVVLGQGSAIDPDYAVIGQVWAGMPTVKRIGSLGTNSESPSQVVKIESVRIHKRGTA